MLALYSLITYISANKLKLMKKLILLIGAIISLNASLLAVPMPVYLTIDSYLLNGNSAFDIDINIPESYHEIDVIIRDFDSNEILISDNFIILESDTSISIVLDYELETSVRVYCSSEGVNSLAWGSVSTPEFMVGNWLSNVGSNDVEDFNLTETSILENTKQNISLYPNPLELGEQLFLDLSYSSKVEIFNLLGVEVLSLEAISGLVSIDTSDFNSGMYIVQIKRANQISSRRLILN